MSHFDGYCPACGLSIRFAVDPERDWVGRVLHERLLADRDTRRLRERPGASAAMRTFKTRASVGAPAPVVLNNSLFEC